MTKKPKPPPSMVPMCVRSYVTAGSVLAAMNEIVEDDLLDVRHYGELEKLRVRIRERLGVADLEKRSWQIRKKIVSSRPQPDETAARAIILARHLATRNKLPTEGPEYEALLKLSAQLLPYVRSFSTTKELDAGEVVGCGGDPGAKPVGEQGTVRKWEVRGQRGVNVQQGIAIAWWRDAARVRSADGTQYEMPHVADVKTAHLIADLLNACEDVRKDLHVLNLTLFRLPWVMRLLETVNAVIVKAGGESTLPEAETPIAPPEATVEEVADRVADLSAEEAMKADVEVVEKVEPNVGNRPDWCNRNESWRDKACGKWIPETTVEDCMASGPEDQPCEWCVADPLHGKTTPVECNRMLLTWCERTADESCVLRDGLPESHPGPTLKACRRSSCPDIAEEYRCVESPKRSPTKPAWCRRDSACFCDVWDAIAVPGSGLTEDYCKERGCLDCEEMPF